ncbi:unnamed protein product [Rotaria magnacalcarata]|uniref:Fibronectin type-III domain-containing protein n=1 Tax=Rotaria magnacalcarata TaxID=392030 RepID=A0A816EKE4_9BILA|nr:unnamed protein product [Rotaria magnacalcarata]CAF1650428.1 unnamed protein product [Rotaria magnacalcarata]
MKYIVAFACFLPYLSSIIVYATAEIITSLVEFSIKQAVAGDGHVVLTWDKVPDVTGYRIEYGLNSRIDSKVVDSETTTLTLVGLDNGSTYNVKVIALAKTRALIATPIVSITLPQWSGLQSQQMGLLVNENDPVSLAVADYYRIRRQIPSENIVYLNIPKIVALTPDQFAPLKAKVDAMLPATVQALAISWTIPFRVGCNSITSALTLGYMDGPCQTGTCNWATRSPYYDSNSTKPFTDFNIRPAMMLAAHNVDQIKSLIDRGIASDGTNPSGSAYIMNTTDSVRSLRAKIFPAQDLGKALSPYVNARIMSANFISGTTDALFYFQGLVSVSNIATNKFPPGAVADHLTSFGGILTGKSGQMSALEFIAGGATGTFGTVSEPCAYSQKFPFPSFVISRYTKGETLIEAYWKSILQVFQGIFVGEPLANPWRKKLA